MVSPPRLLVFGLSRCYSFSRVLDSFSASSRGGAFLLDLIFFTEDKTSDSSRNPPLSTSPSLATLFPPLDPRICGVETLFLRVFLPLRNLHASCSPFRHSHSHVLRGQVFSGLPTIRSVLPDLLGPP